MKRPARDPAAPLVFARIDAGTAHHLFSLKQDVFVGPRADAPWGAVRIRLRATRMIAEAARNLRAMTAASAGGLVNFTANRRSVGYGTVVMSAWQNALWNLRGQGVRWADRPAFFHLLGVWGEREVCMSIDKRAEDIDGREPLSWPVGLHKPAWDAIGSQQALDSLLALMPVWWRTMRYKSPRYAGEKPLAGFNLWSVPVFREEDIEAVFNFLGEPGEPFVRPIADSHWPPAFKQTWVGKRRFPDWAKEETCGD